MAAKQNWVVLFGNAQVESSVITHLPKRKSKPDEQRPGPDEKPFPPHTFLRSNVEFEQGSVSWEAYLPDSESTCEVLLPAENTPSEASGTAADLSKGTGDLELAFGLNCLGAPYGFALLRNYNWEPVAGTGLGFELPPKKWIRVAARVTGSTIDMFVDDVRVATTRKTLRRGQIGLFMQGHGLIKFRNLRVESEQPSCFVVMQFSEDFNVLYKDVIKEVCEQYGYRVIRGDDFHTSGQILDDITQSIRSAALVIADVTPNNANVFYELGYAHGIGKPTILLCDKSRENLPFDISGFRTLYYDNIIGGKAVIEQRLRQHLDSLRKR